MNGTCNRCGYQEILPAARSIGLWWKLHAVGRLVMGVGISFWIVAATGFWIVSGVRGCNESNRAACAETAWAGVVSVVVKDGTRGSEWFVVFEGSPQFNVSCSGGPDDPIPMSGCRGRVCKAGHFHAERATAGKVEGF